MYLAQLQAAREAGQKIKRLGWPNGKYMVSLAIPITVNELAPSETDALDMNANATLTTAEGCNVLVLSSTNAVLGYELTYEDKNSQDWELA
jgi:hypothetical protein